MRCVTELAKHAASSVTAQEPDWWAALRCPPIRLLRTERLQVVHEKWPHTNTCEKLPRANTCEMSMTSRKYWRAAISHKYWYAAISRAQPEVSLSSTCQVLGAQLPTNQALPNDWTWWRRCLSKWKSSSSVKTATSTKRGCGAAGCRRRSPSETMH